MAFATDPPLCTAYSLEFIHKMILLRLHSGASIIIQSSALQMVCQLLMSDCPKCEYALATCNGHLLIPRGVQFPEYLYSEIVVPRNQTEPYCDSKTGKEALS